MLTFDELYSWVKDLPIVDWHNHLDLDMIAADRPLGSLYEVWVKADPYKHRAMRICGEPERLITGTAGEENCNGQDARCPGDAGPTGVPPVGEGEKWNAWMRTLPKLVGNPLFAWAKMELEILGLDPVPYLQGRGENVSLASWTPSRLLACFNVEWMSPCVAAAQLEFANARCPRGRVVPSLRMNAGELVSLEVLELFQDAGCRIVDISIDDDECLEREFDSLSVVASFAAEHDWTMLLHLGALRETSARLRAAAGPAGGFAGMRAPVDPQKIAKFLGRLETLPGHCNGQDARCPRECDGRDARCPGECDGQDARCPGECDGRDARCPGGLPRTILLSLNPEAHAQLAVLAGSFNGEGVPGKVQLGPAWWWCDHEEGIRDVLEKNAAYGVLSTFVGMTTDSRSLLSFVRHDYFRRIVCRWTAEKVAVGAFPDDAALLRPLLENICYRNAKEMIR